MLMPIAMLPMSTEYLIIGSVLSGAVSGASGRTAGHIRPDAFQGYADYASLHGPAEAKEIMQNERLAFEKLEALVRRHNVACNFHERTTFDVCLTPLIDQYLKLCYSCYKHAGGDVSQVRYDEGKEANKCTRIKNAVSVVEWPAASINPAKLTYSLLSAVIKHGG